MKTEPKKPGRPNLGVRNQCSVNLTDAQLAALEKHRRPRESYSALIRRLLAAVLSGALLLCRPAPADQQANEAALLLLLLLNQPRCDFPCVDLAIAFPPFPPFPPIPIPDRENN